MSGHGGFDLHKAEGLMGMGAEIAKQSGLLSGKYGNAFHHAATSHGLGRAGSDVGKTLLAAGSVAAAGAVVAAPMIVPLAIVGGAAYGVSKLLEWLDS